ncbi:MAG: winged helix-turn-helix domain-containing protein [Ferruginibacter sp.]
METNNTEHAQSNISFLKLEFEDVKQPLTAVNKKGYVSYGDKNDYPNYLIDLIDKSGKHGAIVSGKADFIIGKGFAFVEESSGANKKAKVFIDKANSDGESLQDVSKKLAYDLSAFGGCYLEIIFNKVKAVAEVFHLDFSKVRASEDLKTFYFAKDWHITDAAGNITENSRVKPEAIPAFDLSKPGKKQVLFIKEYKPNSPVYPKPDYNAALRYIQIDICIGEYHLNGITNGMFASKLINFNNGIPDEVEQKKVERKVNDKYAGSKNAGKIMLSFNKSGENATTILDLSGTELDKHFDLLDKTTEKQIFSSHRITSPSLFGIKAEGVTFGNNNELRQAFELFENTYVNSKRMILEKNLNVVLGINGIPKVYLQRSEPIGIQLSEATIAANLTRDEIRDLLGRKPITQEQEKPATPTPTPAKFNDDLDDERDAKIFAGFGKRKGEFEIVESRKATYENDFSFYRQYFADVKELTENQKAIIDLLKKDPLTTPAAIAEVLKVSETVVSGLIKGLESEGLIKVSTSGEGADEVTERKPTPNAGDVIDKGETKTTSIKIMYSYEGIKDNRNRPFCAKMLDLDRLYTRQDIEQISARLGYSVWNRRGGWYRPKGATEAQPFCRHFWQVNTVINKS